MARTRLSYFTFVLGVVLIGVFCVTTPIQAAPAMQEGTDATLRVINESEETICYVYISSVTADSWGDNWLGEDEFIPPDEVISFDLPAGDYDILLADCEDNQLLDQRNLTIIGEYELRFPISDRCESLNQDGADHYYQGQYQNAIQKFQEALICYREIGDREGEGINLSNIGTIYASLGEYAAALDYLEQALGILRKIGDREGEGVSLNNIGAIYAKLGGYATALDYYEQALGISREIGNRTGEGNTLNHIGGIYDSLGEYAKALDYYEQALGILREIGDQRSIGQSLNNIGFIYSRLGEYVKALDYYEQVLRIFRKIGDRTGEGVSLNNIGTIYDDLGEYATALDYYEQALDIHREIGDRAGEGLNLNNIGFIYSELGEYAKALECYEQALGISREIDDLDVEAGSLNNIGLIYDSLGEYTKALDYYEQTLGILREIGDRAGEGRSLNNIGTVYARLGEYATTLDYYEQALDIIREIGDRAGEGSSLNNIGWTYDKLGEYTKALDYYEQALGILREIGDRAGEGISLNNIGGIYDSLGEYAAALGYYEQALDVFEVLRTTAGSEAGRASFIAQWAALYDRAVTLYHIQGRDAQAFFTSERGRARAFLDAMATGHVQLTDNAAADLLAHEQSAHVARRAAQDALIQARAQQPLDAAFVADLETQLAAAEAEHTAALEAIEARGDQLAALVPGRSTVLGLSEVQALLDESTTLVSYWVTADQTLAFIVTRENLNTVTLPVSRTELITQIVDFRNFTDLTIANPDSAQTLYDWLIAPLEEYLMTAHLTVIPHDMLHYLPFAALTDGERYLVDDYTLSYLPNASVLQFIQPDAQAEGAPLILGNPTTADYDNVISLSAEREGLGPLPFAEEEAQVIAALYGSQAYIGPEARESRVWQAAGESHILHLAAHGSYNPEAPLYSLIALAPGEEHDGWLTVGEVYGLDLHQTDLVVLSACESHLGDLSAGDELVGLTRAFFFAGTPTVVATLWTVDDQATALLMERFYTHLKVGMGKAAALRQAQLDIRAEYPNPYYWAAFVLSGDGGAAAPVTTVTPPPRVHSHACLVSARWPVRKCCAAPDTGRRCHQLESKTEC